AARRPSIDAALAVDPEQHLAWHLDGTYHQFVVPDAAAAVRAYEHAIAILPAYAPSWNNLALLWIDLGEYDRARDAIRHAIALAPTDALYAVTYGALLAAVLARLDEG